MTIIIIIERERKKKERERFYLTTNSTHFIYGYMASDIWLRTILIVREETRCRHIGYSFRLAARVILYAPSHRQDSTYHDLCYTSRGALAGTKNSSMGPPHEGSIRRPIAPWANALTTELHLAPNRSNDVVFLFFVFLRKQIGRQNRFNLLFFSFNRWGCSLDNPDVSLCGATGFFKAGYRTGQAG